MASASAETLQAQEQSIFTNDIRHIVTGKTVRGFTIVLNKPADIDIEFGWIALAVKNAKIFESTPTSEVGAPTPSVGVEVSPTPETSPETAPSESPTGEPTETPIVSETPALQPSPDLPADEPEAPAGTAEPTPSSSPEVTETPVSTPEPTVNETPIPEITP